MKHIELSVIQSIVNRANMRVNFTRHVDPDGNTGRYVVSVKNLYSGKNPSLASGLGIIISEALDEKAGDSRLYDSIGGWTNPRNGVYHLDANLHFHSYTMAVRAAIQLAQEAFYDMQDDKEIFIDDIENLVEVLISAPTNTWSEDEI